VRINLVERYLTPNPVHVVAPIILVVEADDWATANASRSKEEGETTTIGAAVNFAHKESSIRG